MPKDKLIYDWGIATEAQIRGFGLVTLPYGHLKSKEKNLKSSYSGFVCLFVRSTKINTNMN